VLNSGSESSIRIPVSAKVKTENQCRDRRQGELSELKYLFPCLQVILVAPHVGPTRRNHQTNQNQQYISAKKQQILGRDNAATKLASSADLLGLQENGLSIFGLSVAL
jgi:hypothetical protein